MKLVFGVLVLVASACAPPREPARWIDATPSTTTTSTTTTVVPTPTTTIKVSRGAVTRSAGPVGRSETGEASWYQTFDGTCAHKTIPKGTILTVTNLTTGATVKCRVADRGPYIEGRIVDLDKELFAAIARVSSGVADVRIEW